GYVADDSAQAPAVVTSGHHRGFLAVAWFLSPVPGRISRVRQYHHGCCLLLFLPPHRTRVAACHCALSYRCHCVCWLFLTGRSLHIRSIILHRRADWF